MLYQLSYRPGAAAEGVLFLDNMPDSFFAALTTPVMWAARNFEVYSANVSVHAGGATRATITLNVRCYCFDR